MMLNYILIFLYNLYVYIKRKHQNFELESTLGGLGLEASHLLSFILEVLEKNLDLLKYITSSTSLKIALIPKVPLQSLSLLETKLEKLLKTTNFSV